MTEPRAVTEAEYLRMTPSERLTNARAMNQRAGRTNAPVAISEEAYRAMSPLERLAYTRGQRTR